MKPTTAQTNWTFERRLLKIPITIIDDETGEPREILMRTLMTTVNLSGYGKSWTFSKSNRGKTVLDSRDNKRKPMEYIESELIRLLGEKEAATAILTLKAGT